MASNAALRNRKRLSPVVLGLTTPSARTANPHVADRRAGSALHAQSQAKQKEKNKVCLEKIFQTAGSPGTKSCGKQDLSWYVVVMLCNTHITESGSLRQG